MIVLLNISIFSLSRFFAQRLLPSTKFAVSGLRNPSVQMLPRAVALLLKLEACSAPPQGLVSSIDRLAAAQCAPVYAVYALLYVLCAHLSDAPQPSWSVLSDVKCFLLQRVDSGPNDRGRSVFVFMTERTLYFHPEGYMVEVAMKSDASWPKKILTDGRGPLRALNHCCAITLSLPPLCWNNDSIFFVYPQ